ncbi:MAG: hypothetical protein RLZZ450_393 [Pseudomonadota bacterium]
MTWKTSRLLLALFVLMGACEADEASPATAIAVSIKSDLTVGQELTSVHLRVFEVGADLDKAPMLDFPIQPASDLARPTVITKGSRSEVVIVVQGIGPDGLPQVVQRARAQFMDGKTYNLPVFLARVCKAKNCGELPGQTCYGHMQNSVCEGTCGTIPVAEFIGLLDDEDSPLPTASWSPPRCSPPVADAGLDGGTDGSLPDVIPIPVPPDAAPVSIKDGGVCTPSAPGAPCDLVHQCGCGSDMACGINSSGTVPTIACVTPDVGQEGVPCNEKTGPGCAAGLTCANRLCNRFCDSDKDCRQGNKCVGVTVGSTASPLNFQTCGTPCTSAAQCNTGCCSDQGFCAAKEVCTSATPACAAAGATCTSNSACCSSAPYCLAATAGATTGKCSATPPCKAANAVCSSNSECCSSAPYCNTTITGATTGTCSATAPTPNQCIPTANDTACLTCERSKCCTSRDACLSDTACRALNICFQSCASGNSACFASCRTSNPNGVALDNVWTQCVITNCSTACQ